MAAPKAMAPRSAMVPKLSMTAVSASPSSGTAALARMIGQARRRTWPRVMADAWVSALHPDHGDPFGRERRLLLALDLDGAVVDDLHPAAALRLERLDHEPSPDPLAALHRRHEPDLVVAVVHAHLGAAH